MQSIPLKIGFISLKVSFARTVVVTETAGWITDLLSYQMSLVSKINSFYNGIDGRNDLSTPRAFLQKYSQCSACIATWHQGDPASWVTAVDPLLALTKLGKGTPNCALLSGGCVFWHSRWNQANHLTPIWHTTLCTQQLVHTVGCNHPADKVHRKPILLFTALFQKASYVKHCIFASPLHQHKLFYSGLEHHGPITTWVHSQQEECW